MGVAIGLLVSFSITTELNCLPFNALCRHNNPFDCAVRVIIQIIDIYGPSETSAFRINYAIVVDEVVFPLEIYDRLMVGIAIPSYFI